MERIEETTNRTSPPRPPRLAVISAAMSSIREGVIVTDAAGCVVYLNEAAQRLLGVDAAHAEGQLLSSTFTAVEAGRCEPIADLAARVLSTGSIPASFAQVDLMLGDGRRIPLDLGGQRLRSEDGIVDGVVLTFRDDTRRREAEREALRLLEAVESERKWLSQVLDSIADEVYFADTHGCYTYANPAALTEFGHGSVAGKKVEDVVRNLTVLRADGSPRPLREAPPLRALRGEVVRGEEQIVLTPRSGDMRYRQVSAAPVRDSAGNIIGSVSVVRDVTDRKRAEEAMREADRRKDVFLATLSHELRNPLAPIRTAADLLTSPRINGDGLRRCREIIARQVGHIASLLDDLLDVSRLTRGELRLKKSEVALEQILDAAIETARPLITAKTHTLTLDVPSALLLLEVDPVRMTQVLSNLLLNAAKYTEAGGMITLGTVLDEDALIIFVRDTGIGLSQEAANRVFEMFFQVNPAQEGGEGGLGIGLALVDALVSMHGGRVEVKSGGPNQGSTFSVILPRAVVCSPALPSSSAPVTERTEARQWRVLIADDNVDAADSLAMMLELAGDEVYVAYNGSDALELARRVRPHAALLDLGMPGMNGYELCKRIRHEPWGKGMAIIAVTGWGQDEDKEGARAAGFDHHLTKPVDPELFDRVIDGLPLEHE
jgi:PAS domain S-box-containing protein